MPRVRESGLCRAPDSTGARGLNEHVVVCGAGEAATQAVDRLTAVGVQCAVVEARPEAVRRMRARHPRVPCVLGDANDEGVLHDVRVEQAP